jgi:hypothetical protein
MAQSSHHRHSIGPHPDLPTIDEALESEEDSVADDNIIEAADDNQSDSGSKVSYANSYAFTFDGVGFDEENSLISGICNGSVVHERLTPPQNNRSESSDGRLINNRHDNEKVLQHLEACRKLGIPWSSSNSDGDRGSDNDGAKGSALNAIAVNEGKKKWRKMNWPWPDMGGKMSSTPPTLDSLDENMRNYALSKSGSAQKRRKTSNDHWRIKNGAALIPTVVLIAICMIGILVTAFTSKSDQNNHMNSVEAEVVVMEGHPRPKMPTTTNVGGYIGTVSDTADISMHKTKAGKEDDAVTRFADGEEEADFNTDMCSLELSSNCLLKYQVNKTPIATLTIHLVCEGEAWIGIGFSKDGQMVGSEAVLGVPGGVPQKYVLGGKDNSSVMPMAAHKQTLMDASVQVTRRGLTVLKFTKIMKEEGEVEIKSGENIFLYSQGMGVDVGYHAMGESFTLTLPAADAMEEPIVEEPIVEEPIVEDTVSKEAADGLDSSCVDQPGKFTTSNNKSRACHWMSKSGDTLHSSLQDRECGIQALGTEPSELGLNCRYTCRAYNGCLLQDDQDASIEVDGVQPPPIDELIDGGDAAGVAAPCTVDVCNLELSHTCLLKYKVNIPTIVTPVNTVTIELVCEGEAWIGIGFSKDGQMVGSEAVLGVPGGVPQKYVLGGKDNSSVMPMAAHKQTLMDASAQVTRRGLTVLKFTKIMKEEGEVEIKPGENIFLYAQGMSVDVGFHAMGESFTLSLPGVEEASVAAVDTSIETPLAGDTFIDAAKGLLRTCSWLDIRNWGRLSHA